MQTFTQAERLKSKVAIDTLFASGKSFHAKPFEILWLAVKENDSPVKVVISVPKRLYKRAVDRNKVKRLFREAYRKNKNTLYEKLNDTQLHVMFIYKSKAIIDYSEMEEKVVAGITKLISEVDA